MGSISVVVGALAIALTGRYWIDPVLSMAIGLLVVPRTLSILRESAHVLLEGTPEGIDLGKLRRGILAIRGVEEIHDLHFWTLTSGFHCVSVHVKALEGASGAEVLQAIQHLLKEDAGVDHVTVQLEHGSQLICEVSRGHA